MGLKKYQSKRNFDATPEPKGRQASKEKKMSFVVQKHQASHLHYDFRLEMEGVLRSWAVPKGPSLRPEDKRMAMLVEDHPYDYRNFEGRIPRGNYGAGTVIVWDAGTYESLGGGSRASQEKELLKGFKDGDLKFKMHGKKLSGEFVLIRLKKGPSKNAWLLIKKHDDSASDKDITIQNRSVKSGKSLEDLADPIDKAKLKKAKLAKSPVTGVRRSMPHDIKPMMATLVDKPFNKKGWSFEVKWDGYRVIAEIQKKNVKLYSRNGKSFNKLFSSIAEALRAISEDVILDGEVVVLNDKGRSDFQLLQNYARTGAGNLVYYVFDILYLDGRDLRSLPLSERLQVLSDVITETGQIRISYGTNDMGEDFFKAALKQGLEGIIAKDLQGEYKAGVRSSYWQKIKTHLRQEAVIAGFTEPRGSRTGFGALVLGVYKGSDLIYIGHTGGGFDQAMIRELMTKLEPLIQKSSPFKKIPKTNTPATWVKPKLVCEVSFQEWTGDGVMRQPIYLGLREDKDAKEVIKESAKKS